MAAAIGAYLAHFGLVFACFDFALEPGGRWTYYEANPNGQWAFFDPPITRRIMRALADLLQEGQP